MIKLTDNKPNKRTLPPPEVIVEKHRKREEQWGKEKEFERIVEDMSEKELLIAYKLISKRLKKEYLYKI